MCGRDGRRGGNSCAEDVSGEESSDADPCMGGDDVAYDASSHIWPEDGGVGSAGLIMLSALSIERFTLSFLSNGRKSHSFREGASSSGASVARSRRSRSFSSVHLRSSSAQRVHPFWRASISGVTLCLSGRSGSAPCKRRVRTTCSCPLAAAKWSGVAPELPTIGAEVSLCRSLEYLRGSLREYTWFNV